MPADILILKKRGEKYKIKIKDSLSRGRHAPANCNIVVNMKNYKDLSLFLEDLKVLWGCPVDKAIEEYKRNQSELNKGPFW